MSVYVCHMYTVASDARKGFRFHGTGVMGSCESTKMGAEKQPESSGKAVSVINHQVISPVPPIGHFLKLLVCTPCFEDPDKVTFLSFTWKFCSSVSS